MKHILSSHTRCLLPWSATVYCPIDPKLIYHKPSCDYVGSSFWSKHTLAILHEVGRICLGNSLNPLTRGLYQLSYPQLGTYAGFFFPVILQCESYTWQRSHLYSNLSCNMVLNSLLEPYLIIIFCEILIVIWPHFHLVTSAENVGCRSCCLNKISKLSFAICSVATVKGTKWNWKWNWEVLRLFLSNGSKLYTFLHLMPGGATRQNVNELISLTQSRDTDIILLQRATGFWRPNYLTVLF